MNRPGMTILELLLALALLSGLTLACVSWTTAATRAIAGQGGDLVWRQGAEATLAYIDDALTTEDRSADRAHERWRVAHEAQQLTLRSRQVIAEDSVTPALAETAELTVLGGSLTATFRDAEGRELARRPLLGQMSNLEVTVTEIDRTHRLVSVRLTGERGARAERSWRLTRGDLR